MGKFSTKSTSWRSMSSFQGGLLLFLWDIPLVALLRCTPCRCLKQNSTRTPRLLWRYLAYLDALLLVSVSCSTKFAAFLLVSGGLHVSLLRVGLHVASCPAAQQDLPLLPCDWRMRRRPRFASYMRKKRHLPDVRKWVDCEGIVTVRAVINCKKV